MNNRKGCVSSGPAEWYAARASNTFPSSDPAASWSHYAFHSFFERWSFTLQTSSQAAQRAECSPGSFSTLRVGRLRKSIHFGSALHEPARFDCRFCVFVFLISRRRLTWPPQKKQLSGLKLQEWPGNICHHEQAKSQPWHLQLVAAYSQGGHPKPSLLHKLVNHFTKLSQIKSCLFVVWTVWLSYVAKLHDN